MSSILSHRGYSIDKRNVSADVLANHRKELTVVPFVEREEFRHLSQPIRLYQETDQRLYMPRFYGTRVLGPAKTDKLTTQSYDRCERLVFKGTMRPEQQAPINAIMEALDTIGGGVISLQCAGASVWHLTLMLCCFLAKS